MKNEKNTFGGCYTAPLLIGYIEYIIKESIDNNVRSLFFLARDGYLLKKMADVIIKERKLNINTHYLYSSRKAWRMPSIINKLPENFFTNQWLFDKENIHNMFDVSKFLGLDWKLFNKVISKEYNNKQFTINEENINSISEYLENNINFKKLFFKINKKKRENIKKYLRQEINLNEKFGLIDFYGLGLTHNCFDRIIKDMNVNTDYLYFTFKNESYRFNNKHTRQYQAFGHCFWILEPLLRAPHGQTLGYQEINKKMKPILEERESNLIINWGINDYDKGIVDFVKSYEKIRKKIEIDINFIDIFTTHYESIWNDNFIIEMLGSVPFDIKMGETWSQEFLPRINKKQAIKYLITGKYPKELIWLDGSYIRSSNKIKKILSLRRFINGQSKIYKPLKKIKKFITKK